eukprot:PITA_07730
MYYVSFIGDLSRNTWIYFLKKKLEVFHRFKKFKALAENQIEKKIKVLRTDNGGEFCSNEFEEFCKKCGTTWQKTTPYTPQKNGVTERMNKTLMERARSMLSGAKLGQGFWVEAVETACYLVNRSPSLALEDKTPQEGYKLWNQATRKVLYNRDVVSREVKDVIKHEVQPKEPEKIEFELKVEESDSTAEEESKDEEPQNPVTMKEAINSEDGKLWKEAMVDEMEYLHKNDAWNLVELPAGRKPIGRKWGFKKKTNAEGEGEKYKSRLVEKEQMDVKTTFLHRDLEEDIYMKQPEGFAMKGKKEVEKDQMISKVVDYIESPYASNDKHGTRNTSDLEDTLRNLKEQIRSCKADNDWIIQA